MRQSMSPSSKRATSQDRKPRRANNVKMAKSRNPIGVDRSQLDTSAATSAGRQRRRQRRVPPPRHGWHAHRKVGPNQPWRNRNRSNDRSSVTLFLAEPTESTEHSRSKKAVTSAPQRPATPVSSPP